ncbi:MAG: hypothetical protein U1E73_07945 [Planctomycetota bacterium]
MLPSARAPWQVRVPPVIKYGILAAFAGALAYVSFFGGGRTPPPAPTPPPIEIAVPILDSAIVAAAGDATREQRLVIEPEPLRHLLEKAIDVGPVQASALGMPEQPMPVAEVRERIGELRGHWLWYKGELEELAGPRDGHPVKGYSIYEATIRLPGDTRAICEFSLSPDAAIQRGSVVRIEGYLMKLRDTTYPRDIDRAPLLVGREIRRDYADWGPVEALDPSLFTAMDDKDEYPGALMWHDVEEDQAPPLWHLAAFARDTAARRSKAEWRQVPTLNVGNAYDRFHDDKVARGEPMRVLGTLVKCRSVAALPNPAGIRFWTVAYVQVRDFGGHIIPIWVPKRVDLALRTDLEVCGLFYRWYAYESIENLRMRVPLFVAADLDVLVLESDRTLRGVMLVIGSAIGLLMCGLMFVQWRTKRQSDRHSREMDARRKKHRERAARAAGSPGPPPLSS